MCRYMCTKYESLALNPVGDKAKQMNFLEIYSFALEHCIYMEVVSSIHKRKQAVTVYCDFLKVQDHAK